MKSIMNNKKGALTDLFLFMIFAFIILIICGVMIYISAITSEKMHETLDGKMFGGVNGSQIQSNTFDKVHSSFTALYWLSVMIIVGMIFGIFIGSFMVTTKPVFFIPYIFIMIIAIIVSVGISNAYEQIIANPTLADTFAGFIGSNFIMSKLPLWITLIGFVGCIIMFTRMGSKENEAGGYY